jgi:hypothetical protein
MGIDYSQFAFAKGTPRVLTKAKRAKSSEQQRKDVKAAVFARDKSQCRVCGKPAEEMHELRFRSLGGVRSLENSIAVCIFRGHNCHRLLQTHCIDVEGEDANKRLVFHWNRRMVKKGEEPFRIKSKRRSQQ